MAPLRPGVFIDRDGTLNVEKNYLYRPEDWEWTPQAVEAIKGLNRLQMPVIVVTNQAGIARKLYTDLDVLRLHRYVADLAAMQGAAIDGFYYCPHHPDYDEKCCDCRKPKPGLLLQAAKEWRIDPTRSFMIGDKVIDIEAGIAAGVTPILVRTGYGSEEQRKLPPHIAVVENLLEAYRLIANRIDCGK
ncbi:D-glycero-beta-D-manno-heptose 1,7-bisphosphate 7-phosphatase [Heliobacillus mobilis]|uniref:D,D-heptose 1,7-bisphosphate phosphatase n=1 Tax=Heliobacterium mobile TaxID=28064 RepID=A0A6I3SLB1_HELMO|nr:HAD family hydrolase [Heliobacterium mobile]MTV49693.1 D-glycero-beta-D-manno-heptose 1,7-bisphosphate 7-phosphatase [Heliobacterium mobile]